jgi:hypothetical protein
VVVGDESVVVLLLPDRIEEGEGKISLVLLSYRVLPLFFVPFDLNHRCSVFPDPFWWREH